MSPLGPDGRDGYQASSKTRGPATAAVLLLHTALLVLMLLAGSNTAVPIQAPTRLVLVDLPPPEPEPVADLPSSVQAAILRASGPASIAPQPPPTGDPRAVIAPTSSGLSDAPPLRPPVLVVPRPTPAGDRGSASNEGHGPLDSQGAAIGRNGGGTGSEGGAGNGAGVSTPARARWVSMMSFDELRRFHPRAALRDKLSGRVTMMCRVRLNRRVYGCQVTEEAPAGHGFGAAARRASRAFRVFPRQIDGVEVEGAPVLIPIRFDAEPVRTANASD